MNKKEFVAQLAQRMKSPEAQAERWLQGTVDTLVTLLKADDALILPGLGRFSDKPLLKKGFL